MPPLSSTAPQCAAVDIYNAGSGSLPLPLLPLTDILTQVVYRWVLGFLMTIVSRSCLSVFSASSSLMIGEMYGTSCAVYVSYLVAWYR